jgi:hypothetical protein
MSPADVSLLLENAAVRSAGAVVFTAAILATVLTRNQLVRFIAGPVAALLAAWLVSPMVLRFRATGHDLVLLGLMAAGALVVPAAIVTYILPPSRLRRVFAAAAVLLAGSIVASLFLPL